MKKLHLVFILALLTIACGKEEKENNGVTDREKTDWAFYGLKGNVKSVSEKSYLLTNGLKGASGRENNVRDYDMHFDENGMLTLKKQYRKDTIPYDEVTFNGKDRMVKKMQFIKGKPGIITEYLWDAGKNNTSVTRRNPDNSQIDRIEMKYKGKNLIEKTTFNKQNTPIDIITYDYDAKNNLTGENYFLGVQAVQVKNVYEYDADNKKIGEVRYSNGSVVSKTAIEYDSNGRIISEETTDDKGELEYSEKFLYDAKGNIRSHITFRRVDNIQSEELFEYDARNNKTTVTYAEGSAVKMKTGYTYDENNNITSTKTVDGSGTIADERRYVYEYDTTKNWTKKTIYISNQPKFVEERTVTYY